MHSVEIAAIHSVEIMEIYCHTYLWQKFRENDVFTKEVLKSWFDEKNFST